MEFCYRTSLGQDHHSFVVPAVPSVIKLAGVDVKAPAALSANSDGDVVLHALTQALSGLMGRPVLGATADTLCAAGEKNSTVYVKEALRLLDEARPGWEPVHVSFAIEALRPKLLPYLEKMRQAVADLLGLPLLDVGMTATTGEGLTGMGRGEGIAVLCMLTIREPLTVR